MRAAIQEILIKGFVARVTVSTYHVSLVSWILHSRLRVEVAIMDGYNPRTSN